MEMIGICPTCGQKKQKLKHFVDLECFRLYTNDASDALAKNGNVLILSEWVKERIAARVPILEVKLELLRWEYRSLQGTVKDEAVSSIRKASWKKKVSPEVISEAIRKKSNDLWYEKGGNKLHYEVVSLENEIIFLNKLLKELEEKTKKEVEV